MNNKKDIEEIISAVPLLKSPDILCNQYKITEWDPNETPRMPANIQSFHPSGFSTVVEKEDDYLFGLRANHFVISLGWTEDGYYENRLDEVNNTVLIVANHKGYLMFTLIEFAIK